MFTSRAEYRILLRQDDADARLTERAYNIGLATTERQQWWLQKKKEVEHIIQLCEQTAIKPKEVNGKLEALGTTPLHYGCKAIDLLGRPQVSLDVLQDLAPAVKEAIASLPNRREEMAEAAEVLMKYKGYIQRERMVADKMHRLEDIKIKGHFDYPNMNQISIEARQKLQRINPETLAQASRIPGVSPSDINAMLVLMGR